MSQLTQKCYATSIQSYITIIKSGKHSHAVKSRGRWDSRNKIASGVVGFVLSVFRSHTFTFHNHTIAVTCIFGLIGTPKIAIGL